MRNMPNMFLIAGAICSAAAAVGHLGCIYFGAPWYRFFGAGEQMARMASAGNPRAAIVTSFIVAVLTVWSIYALSGAGVLPRLPLLRLVLTAVTAIYLLRGGLGFLLVGNPLGRSPAFWIWSSAICLIVGGVHAIGLAQIWGKAG
jgi:hypothetical protein